LSCRKEPTVDPPEIIVIPQQTTGFYLLNEGGNSILDYYDVQTSEYHKNIFSYANPEVVKGLGSVGNDLKIYGSKLYAVMNCSNLVEVMNVSDAKHQRAIKINNCRYITFHRDRAYVSSYAGPVPVQLEGYDNRLGLVLEFDTVNFTIIREVTVGYQPEEMAIVNGKLYVANSGGYTPKNYDRTVSVIDLATFEEIRKIDVDINLHYLKADKYGDLWVNSRGDNEQQGSKLYVIDTEIDAVKQKIDIAVSNFCIAGDTIFVLGSDFNSTTGSTTISYNMVDVKTKTILPGKFITDGTDARIVQPYGIAVDPVSHDVYVTDARNYSFSGSLFCFDKFGKIKGKVDQTGGTIPAHIAFVAK
jgi:DNA-binding beta-propeller fold protein YncE